MEGLAAKITGFTSLVLAASFLTGCGGSDEESSAGSALESAEVKESVSNMMGSMKDAGTGVLSTAGEMATQAADAGGQW